MTTQLFVKLQEWGKENPNRQWAIFSGMPISSDAFHITLTEGSYHINIRLTYNEINMATDDMLEYYFIKASLNLQDYIEEKVNARKTSN